MNRIYYYFQNKNNNNNNNNNTGHWLRRLKKAKKNIRLESETNIINKKKKKKKLLQSQDDDVDVDGCFRFRFLFGITHTTYTGQKTYGKRKSSTSSFLVWFGYLHKQTYNIRHQNSITRIFSKWTNERTNEKKQTNHIQHIHWIADCDRKKESHQPNSILQHTHTYILTAPTICHYRWNENCRMMMMMGCLPNVALKISGKVDIPLPIIIVVVFFHCIFLILCVAFTFTTSFFFVLVQIGFFFLIIILLAYLLLLFLVR